MTKTCPICEIEFTPGPKKHKQQTCGDRNCIQTNTTRKKHVLSAKRKAGSGGGLNPDGSVIDYYLERGEITNVNGQSCIGANL